MKNSKAKLETPHVVSYKLRGRGCARFGPTGAPNNHQIPSIHINSQSFCFFYFNHGEVLACGHPARQAGQSEQIVPSRVKSRLFKI